MTLALWDEETYSARLAEMASIALRTAKFLVVCVKFLNYPALRQTPLKTLSTRY